MSYALGGLLLLAGLYLLVVLFSQAFTRADPKTLARRLRWFAGIAVVGLAAVLIYAGRGAILGGIGVLALPFIRGWLSGGWAKGRASSTGGERAQTPPPPPPPRGRSGMTHKEAYDTLGLEAGCSPADIREAHRRLIKAVHPDRGGSAALAARINQARDTLLD